MTELQVQTRPDGVAHSTKSRHRAEPAKQASALSRLATGLGITGHRAAVVTVACAMLVGGAAASQAAEPGTHGANVANTSTATSADPLAKLNFERVQIAAPTAPAGKNVAPTLPEVKAAEPPAAPAAAAPAPAPAPAAAPAPAPAAAPAAAPAPAPAPVAAPAPAAAPVAVDDPAGAQAYAAAQLGSYGWAPGQMQCLQKLWTKESDWKTTAKNPSSGAYGVVQSLPASKMASAGADYLTNYRTQINWGLNYVKTRYGSPCGALNFHLAHNWY
ncbi:hypothetical protein [Arthrobacter sp. NicSoilB8]|uniref:aggregation-promoting factor C-terminal-like domain-containing protein n=1 Tax=Arthrobacter sp. NicSoilB8 TaxID=2830998 RepID=UPI001CC78390|nr:hypothetical protein [Arthrobacter sp. NicSoilB8]BCW69640.1 hypothetical protein NicSoilB8_06840 [Arthrobacter sp. NicSoilB8]